MTTLPSYDQLPVDPTRPPKSSWGVWGDDDELGAINLLTPDRVKAGLACARKGKVFSLNWDLELPNPPFYDREPLKQTIIPLNSAHDDFYDHFYPQQSSQWDALCHVGHPEYGYYNGRTRPDFTGKPGSKNGIDQWARRGIAGRGVILDVGRHFAARGTPLDPADTVEISAKDLTETAEAQKLKLEQGDLMLVRTGWIGWYENETGPKLRVDLARNSDVRLKLPGLSAGEEMARFLWNSHVACIATDTPAFEAWPHEFKPGLYLHYDILALLGIPIGEMWDLERLAADCAEDGVYEFLLTSAPLNKVGGVGSPANAIAIK